MFCSMQKKHGYGFDFHLSRPMFSLRSDNTRQASGCVRVGERRGNVKNEGLMQKNESSAANRQYHLWNTSGMMF